MLRRMPARLLLALLAAGLLPAFVSCKLVTAPVRVVGAVAKGTAKAGKKAAVATAEAFDKSDEEKAAEEEEKEKEDAKTKKTEEKAAPEPAPAAPGVETLPPEYLPELPGTGQPLPGDEPLPYQGQ